MLFIVEVTRTGRVLPCGTSQTKRIIPPGEEIAFCDGVGEVRMENRGD